jgi:peptidoglycan/LPS O-acetylase OafA/YrhL
MDATAAPPAASTSKNLGLATLGAGLLIILGSIGSELADPLFILLIAAFALILYSIPRLHRLQAHADGAAGHWGARLVVFGGAVLILLGLTFLAWEAVGDAPDDPPAWANALFPIGFFSFLIGVIAFAIGSIRAKVFPTIGPALMIIGLVAGVAIDMATGAFFEDDGETTAWGFLIGIPTFGLGLAWIGYWLRGGGGPTTSSTTTPPTTTA